MSMNDKPITVIFTNPIQGGGGTGSSGTSGTSGTSGEGASSYSYSQTAVDATYKYYGFYSAVGWKFKRKTIATEAWAVASGLGDFGTAWDDRAAKTYEDF